FHVTGVQTCALPILAGNERPDGAGGRLLDLPHGADVLARVVDVEREPVVLRGESDHRHDRLVRRNYPQLAHASSFIALSRRRIARWNALSGPAKRRCQDRGRFLPLCFCRPVTGPPVRSLLRGSLAGRRTRRANRPFARACTRTPPGPRPPPPEPPRARQRRGRSPARMPGRRSEERRVGKGDLCRVLENYENV